MPAWVGPFLQCGHPQSLLRKGDECQPSHVLRWACEWSCTAGWFIFSYPQSSTNYPQSNSVFWVVAGSGSFYLKDIQYVVWELVLLLEYNPNLKKMGFYDVNLAQHQKEVLLLLQDPVLQGTANSWVLVPGKGLQVAAVGQLMFKRWSLDVQGLVRCHGGRSVAIGRVGTCLVLCARRAERGAAAKLACAAKKSVFLAIKQRFLTCRAHQPFSGSVDKATSLGEISALSLWQSSGVVVHDSLLGKLCSCTWIRGWSCLQDVITE